MLKSIYLIGLVSVLFSSLAFAGDINAAFESIKNTGTNFDPDGAVCEELERVRLSQQYPADKFLISGDIEYSTGGQTVGELDTVVIDRTTGKVVLLGEVKCWKNFDGALLKAKSQLQRFFWNLQQNPAAMAFTSYDGIQYSAAQFPLDTPVYTVGPQGAVAKGFTYEFDLTLKETHQLRMMLLKCQQNGECPRPQH
ncbi:hypothetical protein DOM22_08300 [Bdellovibrio sp. ZAP7]|uniref:hypothetical protein n=1 Tax=Bdellovibrio sp. ZAP7 TaxID=2231053 RepID=UPI0011589096|nr:hypothetical protein [Bdellovibrio sp. ZAP7]QDK45156.1 hypothetical protein DOM22_08300 [Bdellovibrio sp. ZAP7]